MRLGVKALVPSRRVAVAALAVMVGAGGVLAWRGLTPKAEWPGPTPGPREVRIVARDMRFHPAVVRMEAGEVVRLVLVNADKTVHELESETAGLGRLRVGPGEQVDQLWRAPPQPGIYPFTCEVPGHKESGMVGRFWVESVRVNKPSSTT